ncbi:ATP-binding cassette domain-containing protein [Paenibacillus sp. CAU 1782]
MSDLLVGLKNIHKRYGGSTVLSEATLEIRRGECLLLRGGNGQGKSTLLKLLAGLISPTSGERIVAGPPRPVIGYAPDRLPGLNMTSAEYLRHMGRIAGMEGHALQTRISELHERFKLDMTNATNMRHYSKGMLQKVNMMQASLREPDLLLLDEPFSGLDKESVEHLLSSLHSVQMRGTAIVAAVHGSVPVESLVYRTIVVRNGELFSKWTEGDEVKETTQKGIRYEVKCKLDEHQARRLALSYPSVKLELEGDGGYYGFIPEYELTGFIKELVENKGVLLFVQRLEGDGES